MEDDFKPVEVGTYKTTKPILSLPVGTILSIGPYKNQKTSDGRDRGFHKVKNCHSLGYWSIGLSPRCLRHKAVKL